MSARIPSRRSWLWIGLAFVAGLVIMGGIAFLLTNIQTRKAEAVEFPLKTVQVGNNELDPAIWGQNFPRQYGTFKMTEITGTRTPYGGNENYDKLERYPELRRIWAGYAFAEDFTEERGHFYALIDQKETRRQQVVKQPGACANCHAGEAPLLIAEMGWDTFNSTPYSELSEQLHIGSTCRDCHNPDTMELWISRQAFINAMTERGIDVTKATRQEMRTYVCAQCHVEYYFKGDQKSLTFPWSKGLQIENIQEHYDSYEFKDWTHKESGAPMLKMQHPEFEVYSSSLHYRSGVSCADCHMPYVRDGAVKVSDHWVRSPLMNINQACQTCHNQNEQALTDRIGIIQNNTAELLRTTEGAIVEAIDAIVAAQAGGATDEQLAEARQFHRYASMRYDFIMSDNSTGFHSPQESARVLANAIDFARRAQLAAERLGSEQTAQK